jgi:hypothetical protein
MMYEYLAQAKIIEMRRDAEDNRLTKELHKSKKNSVRQRLTLLTCRIIQTC